MRALGSFAFISEEIAIEAAASRSITIGDGGHVSIGE